MRSIPSKLDRNSLQSVLRWKALRGKNTLAQKITDLRKEKHWSQEELADKLQVSRQSVSKWESEQSSPDIDRIIQLAKLFNVSTDYLLMEDVARTEDQEKSLHVQDLPNESHTEEPQKSLIRSIYWIAFTSIYLALSFSTGKWALTWIIWPVAGIIWLCILVFYLLEKFFKKTV